MLAFRSLLIFSAIFRVALIAYGEWQDRHMEVRYTDVDYLVFSDAASLLASGDSPYKRTTYRYSPLIAFILIPNSLLHASWGKLIFSASDILVGLLIHRILTKRNVPETLCNYSEVAWLLNPFTFTIGTRGNCEPIVSAILLWIILCLMNGKVVQGAIWYGLVVHLRIYPIVYALPIVLCLDSNGGKYTCSKWDSHEKTILRTKSSVSLASVFCKDRILFGLVSGSVFFFLTAFFYYIYGYQFLNEALLYHLTRTDPRHNFSIYFYHIYLHSSNEFSVLEKLISFLPQLTVQLALVFSFAKDLPFCIFLQTLAFVAFNKVMTAQYFVWFFCLLPLIMPWSNIKIKWKGAFCMCLWMGGQLHWLLWGYMLEFKGENVFVALWLASIVFFGVNCFLIITFVYGHRFSSLFQKVDKFD